jgi:squalene cyclase
MDEKGFFNAYWYPSRYFATFLAVRALNSYSIHFKKSDKVEPVLAKVLGFLKKNQNADGGWGDKESNPFDTANAINTLKILDKNNSVLEKGKRYLVETQNRDGSWDSTVIFNYYYTQCKEKDCPEPWHDKNRRILSTAFAVKALRL